MAEDNMKKIKNLKIELLKQPQKRKNIKREIARLLTLEGSSEKKNKTENKSGVSPRGVSKKTGGNK